MVRTGFMARYLEASLEERVELCANPVSAGLSPAQSTATYLWDGGFAAIAADNPSLEVMPRDLSVDSLHLRLIPMLGFPIGELFDLETLAEACRRDGRFSCFFCSVPLNLPGGVGSPGNAIAIR